MILDDGLPFIQWHDFLLILNGQLVHFPAPKSHNAKEIAFKIDTPVCIIAKKPITSHAAQTHYMNADVTLACEGVVLQTVIYKSLYGIDRFFLNEIKNVMFLNKIDVPYCLVVFFVVCPRLRPF